jgi:hypothetical protein
VDASNGIVSLLVVGFILALVFVGCAVVIKRAFIDKKYFGGSQFVGRQIFRAFQSGDRKQSIEHVIYMEEDEEQKDLTGEDKENKSEGS